MGLYLGATLLIALAPGPGILYVPARSIRGGRREGVRSAIGNGIGASVDVVAATAGLSALLAASALAFTVLKFAGAAYLIYPGVRALLELRAGQPPELRTAASSGRSAVVQGFVSEVLNPKTAMFFLAFIPQFVHPERGSQTPAFLALGLVFVVFAVAADLLVAVFAGPLACRPAGDPRRRGRQQPASGTNLIGLGGALALSQN
ncbi:LysE family translocator [Saccharopolyspora erythraea]|uniref:LysE family translocator n=1 Tax=Saccharopolyspora erythraea TaxID=1836 RepID=UPI001BA94FEA|nr:LysE family translocator [Saccharopolyspora erythraea]QUH01324.1 LysE family translocator [Saccharopolyspora erythraea]